MRVSMYEKTDKKINGIGDIIVTKMLDCYGNSPLIAILGAQIPRTAL